MQPYFDPTKKTTWKKIGRRPQEKNEDDLKKIASSQARKLIFGMQPYFDPTRKITSEKMEDDLKKND